MHKLSDNVNRKFIETIDIDEWEVETEDGFVDIKKLHKTIPYEVWNIQLENGLSLKCADTHILITENYDEVFAQDSLGKSIRTKDGISKVISVENLGYSENMYDLEIDSNKHTYYTNDILSHNTTSLVSSILHYVLFNDDKTVALLANKGDTAREILNRIQLAYELLPKWMQQGIVEYNKGSMELENKSRIIAGSTSSSSIRGFSISFLYIDECVSGDTLITIKHNSIETQIKISEIFNPMLRSEIQHFDDMEVLTVNGYKKFYGIKRTFAKTIKLEFDDGSDLICTLNHRIKTKNGFIEAKDLNVGDYIFEFKITKIQDDKEQYVYDLLNVEDGNEYITNNVVSHNCAFVEDWEEFYTSVYPTISSGKQTKVVFTSCVPKNTLVYTNQGLKYVSEFVDDSKIGGYHIPEYLIQGHTKLRTSNVFHNNGFHKTKILKTTSGEVESTLNHKFWAYKQNFGYGWYKAEELNVGDYLSSHAGYNQWGNWVDCSDFIGAQSNRIKYQFEPKVLTPEICYFLGLYIAEGSRKNDYGITITCGDDISKAITDIGLSYYCNDGIHYEISSLHLVEFMQYLGFDLRNTAKKKIIPSKLLTTTKENISALLRGMFDGDGCIYTSNNKPFVTYVSTSFELIKQVKMLLLNYGIFSSTYDHHSAPTKRVKVWSHSKVLELNARQTLQFSKEIGFGLKRKSDRINFDINIRNGSPYDVIPDSYTTLKKAGAKVFCGLTKQKTTNLSRYKLLELKNKIEENNYYGSDELRQFYSDNVSENIRWEMIKDISYSEAETYDFSLPDNSSDKFAHSVIYNGYIGHQTPNSLNHYYKLWTDAIEGKSSFIPIKVTWKDVPGRDEKWKAETIANTSMEAFIQEHEAEFIGSSGTLIDGWKLKELKNWEPISKNNYTSIYEVPEKDSEYILVADVSLGKGIDNSAFTVIKTSALPYKVVATYYCPNIPPDMYAEVIYQAHKYYNDAYVVVENNGPGCETLRVLHDTYECETLLGMQQNNMYGDKRRLAIGGGLNFELGIKTTKSNKPIGCSRLKTLIEQNTLVFGDKNIIDELNRFSRKGNTYQAEAGSHDDIVMTLVIFAWLTTQDIFVGLTNIEVRENIREEYEERFEEELAPFGYVFDGINDTDGMFTIDNQMERELLGYNTKLPDYKDLLEMRGIDADEITVFPIPTLRK